MSFDVYWFRPTGSKTLLEQSHEELPDPRPSPAYDESRERFCAAFAKALPETRMLPFTHGFEHGCYFVRADETDEDSQLESDLAFFEFAVDSALFRRVLGSGWDEYLHDTISGLLFDHGFVAYNPQTGQVLTTVAELNKSYVFFQAPSNAKAHGSSYYWLWTFIGMNLLLAVLAVVSWLAWRVFS